MEPAIESICQQTPVACFHSVGSLFGVDVAWPEEVLSKAHGWGQNRSLP